MTVTTEDDVTICSQALTLLGLDAIESITDPTTDVEAACARIYPGERDYILSKYDWNCGAGERQLARNLDEPLQGGYLYAYRMPSDMLAGAFAVFSDASMTRPVHDWKNANDHIHCNYAKVYIKYRRRPSLSIMPAYLLKLIRTATAAKLAKPLAENTQLGEDLHQEAFGTPEQNGNGGLFLEAKTIDAKSKPIKSIFQNGDPLSSQRY